jgi:hypothetical protein
MPNECGNNLTVVGDEEELFRFTAAVKDNKTGEALCFHTTVPEPNHFGGDYMSDEQAEWRREHWGTEREPVDVDCVENPGCFDFNFLTAWSPCDEWLKRVAKLFPSLNFYLKYDEPGNDVHGVWTNC